MSARKAIETAQSAFDAAKAQGEKLKTAEAEFKLVRERREAADRDLKAFRAALTKAKELQEKQLNVEGRRSEAVRNRRDVADAIEKARADAEVAEADEREMRDLLVHRAGSRRIQSS